MTQEGRLLAIGTPLGDDVLALRSFSLQEPLGRLFQIEAELSSEDGNIDFDKVVGNNVTIRLNIGQKTERYFNGFVSRMVQVANQGGYAHYRATIVPWPWFLTRTADCRIFQKKSTPDIIEAVFQGHGFSDYKLSLSGSYAPREYCVQYRETDFNFVSRLMEQDGIYYFFKHENGKHTLVLADSISAHTPYDGYAEITFHETEKGATGREVITDWTMEKEAQPVACALNDFDFKKPKASLRSNSSVSRKYGAAQFEIYDYPGEYVEASDGDRLAGVRLDELQSQYETLHGQANTRGIATGSTFTLKSHPRDEQNREYLITGVSLHADAGEFASGSHEGEFFSCTFTAMDSSQQFRPLRLTPKPIVQGPQTAIVVGPSGEEIYTDEYGRVKLQFHWDRYGKADENSSCWVRVSQEWAGKKWGAIYIPRIGQEVIVEFLEGDPDRPIITGRVYNADAMPPYALPGEKTKSTLKSNSSKGGNGFNEIRFEDLKGSEQIFVHGQHDMDVRVRNNLKETVYGNREIRVGWEQDGASGGSLNTLVKEDVNTHVKGGQYEHVEKDANRTVDGDVIECFQKNQSTKVNQTCKLNATELDVETSAVISHKTAALMLTGAQSIDAKGGSVNIEGSQGVSIKCGGNFVVIDSSGVSINGTMVNINSGGSSQAAQDAKPAVIPDLELPLDALLADDAKTGGITTAKGTPRQRKKFTPKYAKAPPYKPPAPLASAGGTVPVVPVVPTTPCSVTDLKVQCEHNARQAVAGMLQIVPNSDATTLQTGLTIQQYVQLTVKASGRGSDKIKAQLTHNAGSDCQPQIAITPGPPSDGDWKDGSSATQEIKTPGDDSIVWLDGAQPTVYHVLARGNSDDSPIEVQVEAFPAFSIQGTVNLNIFKDLANSINELVKTTIKPLTGGEVSVEPQVLLPAGNLQVACGWKEYSDWRAYYSWEVIAGLEPLFGISLQVRPNLLAIAGTCVGIPPQLTDYAADIFVHIQVGGQVGVNGRMARVGPDSIQGGIRPDGQVWFELGLGARVGSEQVLSAQIVGTGRTSVTVKADLAYQSGPGGGLVLNPCVSWDGVVLTVRVVTSAFGEEMTNNELCSWTAIDERSWQPDKPYVLIGN